MGILVQNMDTLEYLFYLKGADSVMVNKISQSEKIFVDEEAEILSSEGKFIVKIYL
jgi:magnesium-transporting ATPase (P-type)